MDPGSIFAARFVIEEHTGSGGMGDVYRAIDRDTGERVALKVSKRASARDNARFLREANVLAQLRHPRVVRYAAHGVAPEGGAFLAMEWLSGEDLAKRMARGELTVKQALSVVLQVCEGLGAAHEAGLVHRDLKPSNVFLVGGNLAEVRLIDFGVVRSALDAASMTMSGLVVGTPGYMSPEQVRGRRDIDARADVFALGCLLYRLVTGVNPFLARDTVAILTRILLEDPAPPGSVRPKIPDALSDLVMVMLSKDRDQRPLDAHAVAKAIVQLDMPMSVLPRSRVEALTTHEQRVFSLVVMDPRGRDDEPVPSQLRLRSRERDSRRRIEALRGRLHVLANGCYVVVADGMGAPVDQATLAARSAIALQEVWPEAMFAVATGRGDASSPLPVGEVIDRATELLTKGPPLRQSARADVPVLSQTGGSAIWSRTGTIRVDATTAALVAVRFDLLSREDAYVLVGERARGGVLRTLLGRPTQCVGRERELAMIFSTYEDCRDEPVSGGVLVTAPPGVGKSRLSSEALRRIIEDDEKTEIWVARGDPMSMSAPFGLIVQALRDTVGLFDEDPLDVRQRRIEERVLRHMPPEEAPRVIDFLGELVGTPFPAEQSPQLRAAREDPIVMGDQMRRALDDFTLAECGAHPIALVLDDLHWGDLPTVRWVDAALRMLRDRPFFVLALARPEIHDRFPSLWENRRVQPLALRELTSRAAEKLVRQVLGEETAKDVVEDIVKRGAGNAFYVEELIRSVAEGHREGLPDSVLAMTERRLAELDPEERRVLRAASVFGETFWRGGVIALLGGASKAGFVDDRLHLLVEREVLTSHGQSLVPGERELGFRHALLREAAYAMLTAADKTLGHKLAGRWLADSGVTDAIVMAQHFALGGENASSVGAYVRGASDALAGGDLDAVISCAKKAYALGASADDYRELRLLELEAHHWRADLAVVARVGEEVLGLVVPGSTDHFRAVARVVAAHGRMNGVPRVLELGKLLVELVRRGVVADDARSAAMHAAAEAVNQVLVVGCVDAVPGLFELEASIPDRQSLADPLLQAWQTNLRATRAFADRDMQTWVEATEQSTAFFTQAGDQRQRCAELASVGFGYMELGLFGDALGVLKDALDVSDRLGQATTKHVVGHHLGFVHGVLGKPEEGVSLLTAALAHAVETQNLQLATSARTYLALVALERSDLASALTWAHATLDHATSGTPAMVWAHAVYAAVLIEREMIDEAAEAAQTAWTLHETLGASAIPDAVVYRTYAEVAHRVGHRDTAHAVIALAYEKIMVAAFKIKRSDWSRSYLLNVRENARTLALAKAWGVAG